MKVSFDADGCLLDLPFVQVIAKAMVAAGHDVWVLTSRCGDPNVRNIDLFECMRVIGIPESNVIFTPNGPKAKPFFDNGFELHFDDDYYEVDDINRTARKLDKAEPAVLVSFSHAGCAYSFDPTAFNENPWDFI